MSKANDATNYLATVDRSGFDNKPFAMPFKKKPWGGERLLTDPDLKLPYVGKELYITAGEELSEQVHDEKTETITLVDGKALLRIENSHGEMESIDMQIGFSYTIRVGQRHQYVGDLEVDGLIFEVSTPEYGTTWRLSDKYGRPNETAELRDHETKEALAANQA